MGRVKTAFIKRISIVLMEKWPNEFSADFEANKALVSKFTDVQSKKIRDQVAGYITKRKRAS
ncbi:MAG: 30S ribosomal protein S17e [Candidatus Bathyarchaeia archaeon]